MNELMREEILDQPEALRQSLTRLREQSAQLMLTKPSWQRIIFTGSGDSYLASLALEYAARHYLELEVHVLPAQIAARYWSFKPGDLLVAISISVKQAAPSKPLRWPARLMRLFWLLRSMKPVL
ncbi:MAG: hypothetical protein U0401_25640 [Anaerolineae bacterium]